jgi:hypothetical protein
MEPILKAHIYEAIEVEKADLIVKPQDSTSLGRKKSISASPVPLPDRSPLVSAA